MGSTPKLFALRGAARKGLLALTRAAAGACLSTIAPLLTPCATPSAAIMAQAIAQSASTPLPPRRPAHLDKREAPPKAHQPPATRSRESTEPAPMPAPAQPSQIHPMAQPGPMTHRRAAIRACTLEWQRMQRSGTAGLQIWRDFSMECLQRQR